MKSDFRITVGSDSDFEDLVGDLYYRDQIVAVLTQEEGADAMRIELHPAPGGASWHFSLKDFEEALAVLKNRMWELRRTEADEAD